MLLALILALMLYVVLDASFGQMMGPGGLNPRFATLIGVWKALGGSADPLDATAMQERMGASGSLLGGAPGFAAGSPFGRAGARGPVSLDEGLDLAKAPGQAGHDLLWLGASAFIAALVEMLWVSVSRRARRRSAAE